MVKLVKDLKDVKEIVVPILKKNDIKKAIIFGSYAKGDQCITSDVDMYIDSGEKLFGLAFYGLLGDLEKALGKNVDLIEAIDVIEGSKIKEEIEKYGVRIL